MSFSCEKFLNTIACYRKHCLLGAMASWPSWICPLMGLFDCHRENAVSSQQSKLSLKLLLDCTKYDCFYYLKILVKLHLKIPISVPFLD